MKTVWLVCEAVNSAQNVDQVILQLGWCCCKQLTDHTCSEYYSTCQGKDGIVSEDSEGLPGPLQGYPGQAPHVLPAKAWSWPLGLPHIPFTPDVLQADLVCAVAQQG